MVVAFFFSLLCGHEHGAWGMGVCVCVCVRALLDGADRGDWRLRIHAWLACLSTYLPPACLPVFLA